MLAVAMLAVVMQTDMLPGHMLTVMWSVILIVLLIINKLAVAMLAALLTRHMPTIVLIVMPISMLTGHMPTAGMPSDLMSISGDDSYADYCSAMLVKAICPRRPQVRLDVHREARLSPRPQARKKAPHE